MPGVDLSTYSTSQPLVVYFRWEYNTEKKLKSGPKVPNETQNERFLKKSIEKKVEAMSPFHRRSLIEFQKISGKCFCSFRNRSVAKNLLDLNFFGLVGLSRGGAMTCGQESPDQDLILKRNFSIKFYSTFEYDQSQSFKKVT